MASQPKSMVVTGLFGYMDIAIAMHPKDRITILTGPNGSGKTTILRILHSMVALDWASLSQIPFREARIEFVNGTKLVVSQDPTDLVLDPLLMGDAPTSKLIGLRRLEVAGFKRDGSPYGIWVTEVNPDSLDGLSIPPSYQRINEELWVDTTDGEIVSKDALRRRFSMRPGARQRNFEPGEPPRWMDRFRPNALPTLIATARLDFGARVSLDRGSGVSRAYVTEGQYTSQIRKYVKQISQLVAQARRESQVETQRLDSQFPSRAFEKTAETFSELDLRNQYERIVNLIQDLHGNGLAEESIGLKFPTGKKNPVELRILKLFLDNWELKLQPLLPMNMRIQLLREIVGEKMKGKSLVFRSDGEIAFSTRTGQSLLVEALSSGEQHLLALFSMLLFSAKSNSLVLIDEPEISLHVGWQHEFLSDVTKVADAVGLNIVLATHSPSIINGQWTIVEELGL